MIQQVLSWITVWKRIENLLKHTAFQTIGEIIPYLPEKFMKKNHDKKEKAGVRTCPTNEKVDETILSRHLQKQKILSSHTLP